MSLRLENEKFPTLEEQINWMEFEIMALEPINRSEFGTDKLQVYRAIHQSLLSIKFEVIANEQKCPQCGARHIDRNYGCDVCGWESETNPEKRTHIKDGIIKPLNNNSNENN